MYSLDIIITYHLILNFKVMLNIVLFSFAINAFRIFSSSNKFCLNFFFFFPLFICLFIYFLFNLQAGTKGHSVQKRVHPQGVRLILPFYLITQIVLSLLFFTMTWLPILHLLELLYVILFVCFPLYIFGYCFKPRSYVLANVSNRNLFYLLIVSLLIIFIAVIVG